MARTIGKAASTILSELNERLGTVDDSYVVEPGDTEAVHDLTDEHCLLPADHPWIVERLRGYLADDDIDLRERWASEVRAGLTELFGPASDVVVCSSGSAAAAWAVEEARARTNREAAVVSARLDPSEIAETARAARARGALVLADEILTAGRLARGISPVIADASPNVLWVGESLACGLPFGAVISNEPWITPPPAAEAAPLALGLAAATLDVLRSHPVHERLAAVGEAVRERIAEACARENVQAELLGPPTLMRIRFAGQENATPEEMLHHFRLELEKLGVRAGERIFPTVPFPTDDPERIPRAFDVAIGRIRTLLVEYNSWLSGGLAYPFPTEEPLLRERGLARYRYPSTADTTIGSIERGVRITFAPEDGKLTSSGFYVPTALRDDFELSIDYEIRRWQPGPGCACFALFVQNEPSTSRHYAQRMTTAPASDRHELLGVACGVESERRPVSSPRGSFRLRRRGARLTTWHRDADADEWILLGTDEDASADDMIVGAKIWTLEPNEGLEVDFTDLRIEARIPADQIPLIGERADPRGNH